MLKRDQISDWIRHPVTQSMLDLILAHKAGLLEELEEYALNCADPHPNVTGQYRGQVMACDKFLDLKNCLLELSDEYQREETEDALQGLRTQSSIEGS